MRIVRAFPVLLLAVLAACGGGSAGSSGPQPGSGGADAQAGGSGTAVANFDGKTFHFSGGVCSTVLDVNQFVFTEGDKVSNYFNISVLDLKKPVDHGGTFNTAVLYVDNGKLIFNPTDATLKVKDDLSGGTFGGKDFATHKPVTGSYTC